MITDLCNDIVHIKKSHSLLRCSWSFSNGLSYRSYRFNEKIRHIGMTIDCLFAFVLPHMDRIFNYTILSFYLSNIWNVSIFMYCLVFKFVIIHIFSHRNKYNKANINFKHIKSIQDTTFFYWMSNHSEMLSRNI